MDGGGDDKDMLRDGITEDVSTRLARFDDVRVISKASAGSVSALKLTMQEIGTRLDVDVIVTGRLRITNDNVTVATNVIRASDARELWTAEFVRPTAGRLALQRDLAEGIADTLHLRSDNAMTWPTRSPRAYALYIRGRAAFDSFTREGRQQALRLYEEALTIDPDFALAHAGAAEVYLVRPLAIPHIDGQEALQRGTELAAKALTLDSLLPEAHLASAAVSSARSDWDAAERSFKKAIELNPSNILGHQQYSLWLSLQGRVEASIVEAHAASSLDPLSPRAIMSIASALRFARRYDEALAYNRRALELDPTFGPAFHNTGLCLQGLGRLDEAIDAYRKTGVPTGNLGHALAVAGRTSEAREMLHAFMRLQEETNRGTGDIAQILIGLGEYEQALDWIERTERLEPGGPSTFKVAAVWDPLRTNPRFVALLKKWKLDR
jgi:tetratricopeptide (TPR) repeat protein